MRFWRRLAPTPPQLLNRYWRNIIRFVEVCLAIVAVLGLMGAYRTLNSLVTGATHPARVPITRTPAELGVADYQDIIFDTSDGVKLHGWYIPSQNSAAVILGHGHAGNREQLLSEAGILARRGYGVLLFDWRAHGESEGDMVTFGLNEVHDLDAAVGYVASRPDVDPERIGVIGFSMGGATAALEASRDERIKAVIIEGAYAIFGDTARYRFKGLPLAGHLATWWGRLSTGIDPDSIRPVDAICAISPRPVLLIYGTLEDGALAPGSARQMFDAACDPKALWMIEGAWHGGYAAVVPDEYEQRIIQFFDNALW